MRLFKSLAGIMFLASAGLAWGQEQARSETAKWFEQRAGLRKQAQSAFSAETAREKAGDCPNANSTREQEECLTAEIATTQSNYASFAGAIRAMLQGPDPSMPSEKSKKEFDQLEAESKQYREHAASAAFDQYLGGTLAPVFELEAQQQLLRLHMREIAFIYGDELSNH